MHFFNIRILRFQFRWFLLWEQRNQAQMVDFHEAMTLLLDCMHRWMKSHLLLDGCELKLIKHFLRHFFFQKMTNSLKSNKKYQKNTYAWCIWYDIFFVDRFARWQWSNPIVVTVEQTGGVMSRSVIHWK